MQSIQLKTSLDHLPADKQEEIRSITDTIVELINPEMIILFGSYSRGNWVEDRYKENGTIYEYKSDYDILVVTEHHQDMPPGLSKQVRRRVRKAENLQTTPHIIFHDIEFLNKELEDGHYFFADIVKEGTMLFNTSKYELANPKALSGYHRAQKAKLYFTEWFKSAEEFLIDYNNAFNRGSYAKAIFELHQATERLFMTILLVFTDYKPKIHDLEQLNREVCFAEMRFKPVFPNQTDEEKRLFALLVKSYIDSRYKLGYTVAPEDLQWLADRVQKLKELAELVCNERIDSYHSLSA
jgi:HEPN domain-containing protein/predicted nucleotidyltransferase